MADEPEVELTPHLLLAAYIEGVFPMGQEDGSILWYDPDPRAILPLDQRFNVPRSLARVIRRGHFEIRINTAFHEVMLGCAAPAPGREETWINAEILRVYGQLHRYGFAHSVESWQNGVLVGGLYGVALHGFFAGESMFSIVPEASKVALVALVERLRLGGFQLLDIQFITSHLQQFGAIQIPRREYKWRLAQALAVRARFPITLPTPSGSKSP